WEPGEPWEPWEPGEPWELTPNFGLQPGLPPPELHTTMRLPVVRVRRADPVGTRASESEPPTGVEDLG
ncbi:MAG: hypothetical protein OEW29_09415, partial [Acidimicrobiia bacterium]|nr:hypothetical protein [Acidimicrobiia bacterium]